MDFNSKASSYVLISKRYFSRYVLTYELLPLDLCYMIDGKTFFDTEIRNILLSKAKISDKEVILELKGKSTDPYVSLSDLLSVGFTTQDSLDSFQERSYENFDVGQLHCLVIEGEGAPTEQDIEITAPNPVDKFEFSKRMALVDAIVGLAHSQLLSDEWPNEDAKQHLGYNEETIDFLLGTTMMEPVRKELATNFFKLCTQFNIDKGWVPSKLVDTFERTSSTALKETTEFVRWLSTARKLLNNEELHIPFTDDGNVTLRAMTLVLLNPEKQNLEAMKDIVGNSVYKLAAKFIQARTGYSCLNAEQRNEIGEARSFLQQLNARLHNPTLAKQELPALQSEEVPSINDQEVNSDATGSGNGLLRHNWLVLEAKGAEGEIIRINGIKPLAGFNLNLIYREKQSLSLRIIDAGGPKGMDKFKGQLAQSMVIVQKDLPDSSRFEKNEHGLYLTLPLAWAETEQLKYKLEELFVALRPLKIEQKSSNITWV